MPVTGQRRRVVRVVEQLAGQPFRVWRDCGSYRVRRLAKLACEGRAEPTDALASLDNVAPSELAIAKQLNRKSVCDWPCRFHQIRRERGPPPRTENPVREANFARLGSFALV